MPIPTPFHPRTSEACSSLFWKEWAGYHAVRSYDTCHEREYYALRHAAVAIDVSPLFKVDVRGPQAAEFLSFVTVRNLRKLGLGRVTYLCWCDDDGKVLDDGTVMRLGEEHYRITSADPGYFWLARHARGFDVELEDVSGQIASLAVQGPTSRDLLQSVCADDLSGLGFFRSMQTRLGKLECLITRTGYTGDLGFELWLPANSAVELWDTLFRAGGPFGLLPAGLDALDVSRVEAGFILLGIDYMSARRCLAEHQKSTPTDIGLERCVQLEREPFLGQAALLAERERGPAWNMAGLVIDWEQLEALFEAEGLPPSLPTAAWRGGLPVYADGRQVGRATSGVFSPTLKQNLAIGQIEAAYGNLGRVLEIEATVEHKRHRVAATVTNRPFYDPPHKRS